MISKSTFEKGGAKNQVLLFYFRKSGAKNQVLLFYFRKMKQKRTIINIFFIFFHIFAPLFLKVDF